MYIVASDWIEQKEFNTRKDANEYARKQLEAELPSYTLGEALADGTIEIKAIHFEV